MTCLLLEIKFPIPVKISCAYYVWSNTMWFNGDPLAIYVSMYYL